MRAKEYLNQVGILDAQLKMIDSNIEKLRKELYEMDDISLSSTWGDGQPHGTIIGDPTGTKASQLADSISVKREEIVKELRDLEYEQIMTRSELWTKRMEVIETIEKILDVSDPMSKVYYDILTMKYVNGDTWEDIAVAIRYTWRHTFRLHGEALKKIEGVIR